MTTSITAGQMRLGRAFAVILIALFVLAACASKPHSPQGATDVRNKLTMLQNDTDLATRARPEIREAEEAVRIAEQPLSKKDDAELGQHRVYMADRKVEIARAVATTRLAEDQRVRLSEERDKARLQARTLEADRARSESERLRGEADVARTAAAESSAEAARLAAAQVSADATRQAAELQRQIDILQAKETDRGLVVTLGDVLFATGSAELQAGPNNNLDKLVGFLNKYPEQRVQVEGHTDNVGSAEFNKGLSLRRAESVRNYLTQQGIPSRRITISGMGLDSPVADNSTAAGRLQNRRVEIVIEKPQEATSATGMSR